jgi:hypothetical protein
MRSMSPRIGPTVLEERRMPNGKCMRHASAGLFFAIGIRHSTLLTFNSLRFRGLLRMR